MTMARTRLLFLLLLSGCDACGPQPPILAEVPTFELTNQEARRFSSNDLRGHVWVANTIFTTCPTVCPMLTTQMSNLQRRVDDENVYFVSLSVDPENDTPARLKEYALQRNADLRNWMFLTGSRADMERVIVSGLHVRMGERDASGDIPHGTHFVLVDRTGHIRGYYGTDRQSQEKLEADIRRVQE